jgi:beta-lactam-binding protein with PASTA domain
MKKIALVAALALAGTAAFAGNPEPVVVPEVEAQTSSSAGGILVPLLLLVAIAAAA